MKSKEKAYWIAFGIVVLMLFSIITILVTQEHYKVARYEVESVDSHVIYFHGGKLFMNHFYYSIKNDFNLSKGDDILVHYMENYIGYRIYIMIEKI